ncbi:hypothetical protein Tco_1404878 [Tanacetum coccineum]
MSQKTEALSKPALTILESSPDCGVKVAEDGAHLFVILTTVRKVKVYERSTLSEDKIVRVETGSINHEERSQCEDALSPNLGKLRDLAQSGEALSHVYFGNEAKAAEKERWRSPEKDKPQAILMIQSRQKAIRQKITQSFSPNLEMLFPHLRDDEGTEGPLIIEAEIGNHQVHCICIDGCSSFKILYEHCFNRLRPEIKNQMVPATTSLIGFSGEIKWPLGRITLLVIIEM